MRAFCEYFAFLVGVSVAFIIYASVSHLSASTFLVWEGKERTARGSHVSRSVLDTNTQADPRATSVKGTQNAHCQSFSRSVHLCMYICVYV